MNCSLNGANAKLIAKAIQSLAKFGTELYFEADKRGLQLRAFNASKSAVGTIRFQRIFFETYHLGRGNEICYCKLALKACLNIFKNMRQVERCEIRILSEQAKLQIQFYCLLETIKNALITIMDDDNLTAAVSVENTTNLIIGSHKVFYDISNNFNTTEVELTLEADNEALTAKNYIEGSRVNDRFMRSKLKLNSTEFQTYNVENESAITFSLKEFRAFLAFAECLGEDVILNFNNAGDPFFVTIKKLDLINCTLIMSTLFPEDITIHEELIESNNSNVTHKRKHSDNDEILGAETNCKRRFSKDTTLSNDTILFNYDSDTTVHSADVVHNRNCANNNDDILLISALKTVEDSQNPNTTPPSDKQSEMMITFVDTESVEPIQEESIPQSPQPARKSKLRRVFSRCFENTYIPKEPSPNSQMFAPESDNDD